MKHLLTIHSIIIAIITIGLTGQHPLMGDDAAEIPPDTEAKGSPTLADEPSKLPLIIATLTPDTTVLTVGDYKLTWKEISKNINEMMLKNPPNVEDKAQQLEKQLKQYLKTFAQRGLFLLEANQQGITVTDAERLKYEAELEEGLKKSEAKITKEDVLASFAKGQSTLAKLSYEDTLKILKLDKIKFENLTVSDEEIAQYATVVQALNNSFKVRNEEKRKLAEDLLTREEIRTDEGFAELAKEFSDGKDAPDGGLLDYDFTREELAELNGLKEFNYQPGETTPVFDVGHGFRIMRVLKEVPPKEEGQPVKYRLAQMLFGKIQMQPTDAETLRAKLAPMKHKKAIADYAMELSRKYPVKTIFFSSGLWQTEQP